MLDNMFFKGTQGRDAGIPVNFDWCFPAKVVAYDDTTGMIQANSIWDADSSKKTFYARAFYNVDMPDIPTSDCVTVGEYIILNRVGHFNSAPSSAPTAFEQGTSAESSKVSFIALVQPTPGWHGVDALAYCDVGDFEKTDIADVDSVSSMHTITTLKSTNLQRVKDYSAFNNGDNILVNSYDTTRIICDDALDIGIPLFAGRPTCTGTQDKDIYVPRLLPAKITYTDTTTENCWSIESMGSLDIVGAVDICTCGTATVTACDALAPWNGLAVMSTILSAWGSACVWRGTTTGTSEYPPYGTVTVTHTLTHAGYATWRYVMSYDAGGPYGVKSLTMYGDATHAGGAYTTPPSPVYTATITATDCIFE